MSARVIHVGEDYWHRLKVLRRSGLTVDECRGIEELATTLRTGTDPHAVLLAESPLFDPAPATVIVRSATRCPVILFSVLAVEPAPHLYDVVVPPLTDPTEWLDEIWETIRKSQKLWEESRALREASEVARWNSEELRRTVRAERARAQRIIRSAHIDPEKPDGD